MENDHKRKGGRHRMAESVKRNIMIKTKVKQTELDIIKARAKRSKLSLYSFLREAAMNDSIIEYSPEEWQVIQRLLTHLEKIRRLLNSLNKSSNSSESLKTVLSQLTNVITELSNTLL